MRSRKALVSATLMAIVLSACDPGELGTLLDALDTDDFAQSSDPGVQAAGQTPVEILAAGAAEEQLERGLAEQDLAAVQQASALRPFDARYPFHEAAMLSAPGEVARSDSRRAIDRATALVFAQHPDWTVDRKIRVSQEMYLNALRDVIRSAPDFEGRADKVTEYCRAITSQYPDQYTDIAPLETAQFLTLEADRTLCE